MAKIVEHQDDIFPFKVSGYYPRSFGEVVHWCEKNCKFPWRMGLTKVVFDSEDDAVLFALWV